MRFYFLITFIFLTLASCSGSSSNSNNSNKANNTVSNTSNTTPKTNTGSVPTYSYEVVKTYPHDPKAFTQGLVVHNGFFYEGTGGYRGRDNHFSSLRKVEIETGKVLQKVDLADDYFGEGITIFNDKIYQLTWNEHTAFVYDLKDFTLLKRFTYNGEGWGLTHDGKNLIMSDGTHIIRFLDSETFGTARTLTVLDEKGKPIMELNELEYVKGEIWANVWQEGWIARIDPASGKLLGRIDLVKLADEQMEKDRNADVLNGIAYDQAADRIFITGKKWKNIFEIKIKDQ
jgi:glutaminyl-peptide cyclotransferase